MNEQPASESRIPAQDGVRASQAEQAAALAETRLAELDASDEPSRLRRWQFGLGPLLVLLTLVAIYLGITRSFSGSVFIPLWMEISTASVLFIWLLVLTLRSGFRIGLWWAGRQRQQARRGALTEWVDAKRAIQQEQGESLKSDSPETRN